MRWNLILPLAAAYLLVVALAMLAMGAEHTYSHALKSFGAKPMLPILTTELALPMVGRRDLAGIGAWVSWILWGAIVAWPFTAGAIVFRRALPPIMLVALLLPWLMAVLSIVILVALGLWLPFALM